MYSMICFVTITCECTGVCHCLFFTEQPSPAGPLKVYFAADTPRREGSSIVVQMATNKPATLMCRLTAESTRRTMDCKIAKGVNLTVAVP